MNDEFEDFYKRKVTIKIYFWKIVNIIIIKIEIFSKRVMNGFKGTFSYG